MGMDVDGLNPKNETGEYFRNNVWWWRPLADYCCEIAPEVCSHCINWQSNDGDGLDEFFSLELAKRLKEEISSGRCKEYEESYMKELNDMPLLECKYCKGTGVRRDTIGISLKMPENNTCNGCNGEGKVKPMDTWYPFSVENVVEFTEFLENCGGFKIL